MLLQSAVLQPPVHLIWLKCVLEALSPELAPDIFFYFTGLHQQLYSTTPAVSPSPVYIIKYMESQGN